jgi:hypothetical protein
MPLRTNFGAESLEILNLISSCLFTDTNMLKIPKYAISINIILALLFVYSNYYIWDILNKARMVAFTPRNNYWSAFDIQYDNGMGIPSHIPNFPFIISLLIIAANLFFIIFLSRQKNTHKILETA